jgi:DNA-binding transcriptional ArsR family regulator
MLAYRLVVGNVFRALADPTRRVILDELRERDGQTLSSCASGWQPSTDWAHPAGRVPASRRLEDAGLVSTRRQGRYKFHYLDTVPLNVIVERRM